MNCGSQSDWFSFCSCRFGKGEGEKLLPPGEHGEWPRRSPEKRIGDGLAFCRVARRLAHRMRVDKLRFKGETPLQKKSFNLSLVDMPDRPTPEPASSASQNVRHGSESDLGELAALFAAHGGGNFSAEVSAELALDIVLNEIVEQACLATGATGAAIILERGGEMVCRASSGVNSPELGSRLGGEHGLTAECIRTREVQRCEDALKDPRADGEASRSLGVRSVVIIPLLRDGELAGLLEVFSSQRGAFGQRDELTLEALGLRVLKNLKQAREASSAVSTVAGIAPNSLAAAVEPAAERPEPLVTTSAERVHDKREDEDKEREKEGVAGEELELSPRPGIDVVTLALSGAVVACALLLATLLGLRLHARTTADVGAGGIQTRRSGPVVERNSVGQSRVAPIGKSPAIKASSTSETDRARQSEAAAGEKISQGVPAMAQRATPLPAGSLAVYENGKEIFRMPAAAKGSVVQRASAVDEVVSVSSESAEDSLLHRVEPEYPEAARQQQIQGAVALDVHIGRDGTVHDVQLVAGPELLAEAAIAAVKQWKFRPRIVRGRAVEMQTRVTLNFRMPG
jgi:TonB family protein